MVFRIPPSMAVGSYKTYQIRAPKTAHTRIGTCQSADCDAYQQGWITRVDEATSMGARQAGYIRTHSGRRFTEARLESGLTEFRFYPGQQCFTQHHVMDRPTFHVVRDGDWRGNPSGRKRLHTQGRFWVEDFAEHQAKLADQIEKG